ncbi:hypothetical protein N9E91_04435 [Alphaproteobacteria bacterium]|jgi:predicted metal-dependent enzyme (double-stranded beta helix superfamily)|nr:hypothetical protein [Alphaproteobacteria bacterium]NCF47893.1 hypothetical protein [Bacteroidota bacterium]
MTEFDFDGFIETVRKAAASPAPAPAVRAVMDAAFANWPAIRAAAPPFEGDEILLFEEEGVSIYLCQFFAGRPIPPHNHNISAVIGLYDGAEDNDLYSTAGEAFLTHSQKVEMKAGDVLSMGPSAIHTVTCRSDVPSLGIHVYLGKLAETERNLFDTEREVVLPFTDDTFNAMVDEIATA